MSTNVRPHGGIHSLEPLNTFLLKFSTATTRASGLKNYMSNIIFYFKYFECGYMSLHVDNMASGEGNYFLHFESFDDVM